MPLTLDLPSFTPHLLEIVRLSHSSPLSAVQHTLSPAPAAPRSLYLHFDPSYSILCSHSLHLCWNSVIHTHTHTQTAELVHAFLCKCVEGNCITFFSNIADFSYTLTLFCFSFSQILYCYSIFETKKIHLHASIFCFNFKRAPIFFTIPALVCTNVVC